MFLKFGIYSRTEEIKMKTYIVKVEFSGTAEIELEAETAQEAIDKAEATVVTDGYGESGGYRSVDGWIDEEYTYTTWIDETDVGRVTSVLDVDSGEEYSLKAEKSQTWILTKKEMRQDWVFPSRLFERNDGLKPT